MKLLRISKISLLILILILIGAFWVRLYKIDNPIADWHSWRQADTAAVARNFFKEGFTPLYPKGDDMSTISEISVHPNLKRLRFVEFPIYPTLVYFAYQLNGGVNEVLARLVAICFSLGSIIFLYFITKKYFGNCTALVASFVMAFLPYSIYYSRVILPEPSLVFFCLGMFYFLDRWIWENKVYLLSLGLLFMSAAFLTKPMAVFYLLPLIYSVFQKEQKFIPRSARYLWLIVGLLPFFAWRLWINQYPEGIPASTWLLNGNGIRFRPAFWRWILVDRFNREMLSITGTVFLFLGLLLKSRIKEGALLHFLALASFLYIIIFATGNVQHDYYQALIVPAVSIFVARGFVSLMKGTDGLVPRLWTIPFGLLFFSLMFYLTWVEIKGLYQVNNWAIVEAGRKADKILPKNAVVVAPYGGDTAFLYQVNRPGFPLKAASFDELINQYGVTSWVSVAKDDDTKEAMSKYQVIEETDKYVIIDLTKPLL